MRRVSGIQVETHELALNEEQTFKVVVWEDGDVELYLDDVAFTVANLANMVRFTELHAQVEVKDA